MVTLQPIVFTEAVEQGEDKELKNKEKPEEVPVLSAPGGFSAALFLVQLHSRCSNKRDKRTL